MAIFWHRHHLAVVADLTPTHVLAPKMLIQLSLIYAGSSHWAKTRATHMAEPKERRWWELLFLQLCRSNSWAVSGMANSSEITGRTHRNGRKCKYIILSKMFSSWPENICAAEAPRLPTVILARCWKRRKEHSHHQMGNQLPHKHGR